MQQELHLAQIKIKYFARSNSDDLAASCAAEWRTMRGSCG